MRPALTWSLPGLALALLLGLTPLPALAEEEPAAEAAQAEESAPEVDEADAEQAEAEPEEPKEDPLVLEARALVERLETSGNRRAELDEEAVRAEGDKRLLLEEQIWQQQREVRRSLTALGSNLLKQEKKGLDIEEFRTYLRETVRDGWPRYRQLLLKRERRIDGLYDRREKANAEDRPVVDAELVEAVGRIIEVYRSLIEWIEVAEPLGIDMSGPRDFSEKMISDAAEEIAAGLRVRIRLRDEQSAKLADRPDDAELKARVVVAKERVERSTERLEAAADMMERLGLDTAAYRQLLFASTGELTTKVLDRRVALGLVDQWRRQFTEALTREGPRWLLQAFVFVAILAIFRTLASLTRRLVQRSVNSAKMGMSQLLRDTLVSWSGRLVWMLGILIALSQLGVQIGPLLAGLGIAGFVLGFALQDSLSNFAAGAMILAYRPYDVGDTIEAAGVRGQVSAMSLVATTFLTFDNQTLIVPNSKIWGDVIRNVTSQRIRRIDMIFGVHYDADVDHVDAVLRDVLEKNEKVLDHPKPTVEVHALNDSSVDFAVRPWVRTEDYWDMFWALNRAVKKRLDAEGIVIPFPQRDVHVYHHDTPGGAPPTQADPLRRPDAPSQPPSHREPPPGSRDTDGDD